MSHLAEFNIATLHQPLDAEENAEFIAALDPINALAEATPGFIWRLQDEDGASASYVSVEGIDDERTIINLSVWADLESLHHFITRSGHATYLRRRNEWFEKSSGPTTVCWWIDEGTTPSAEEGHQRLQELAANGPSERGWPLHQPLPKPDSDVIHNLKPL